MTERAFDAAALLLARGVGLRLEPTNRSRLTHAVRDAADARGVDLNAYVALLDADPEVLQDLLNRVTVQETSFFRDAGQFAALAQHVAPQLREPVLMWSAGSANGQEAYSIAMTLVECGFTSWRVIATDISTNALSRVRRARYSGAEIKGLSPERRARFLVSVKGERDQWEIASDLRERVFAQHHNLASESPPFETGTCQVVFCRNVLIYFGHDDVSRFIDRLATHLDESSHLFLGYSESLWQVSDRFHLVRLGDAFVYRKGPAAAARRAPQPPRAAPATRPVPTAKVAVVPKPPAPVPAAAGPSSVELLAIGEAALGEGDHQSAIDAFRKAAYLDPDHPIAHLNLGLSLEAAGDGDAARRAYAAARAALGRSDTAVVEATLEGYHLDELIRLLDLKAVET